MGALAPAVLINGPIRGSMRFGNRETRDADSLVELHSWEEWKMFIEGLVALGFQRDKQEYRLRYGKITTQVFESVSSPLHKYFAGLHTPRHATVESVWQVSFFKAVSCTMTIWHVCAA